MLEGQLNQSGLTLNDVEQLRLSFIETLKGRFHIRVQYPGNELLTMENLPELGLPAPSLSLPGPAQPEVLTRGTQTAKSG